MAALGDPATRSAVVVDRCLARAVPLGGSSQILCVGGRAPPQLSGRFRERRSRTFSRLSMISSASSSAAITAPASLLFSEVRSNSLRRRRIVASRSVVTRSSVASWVVARQDDAVGRPGGRCPSPLPIQHRAGWASQPRRLAEGLPGTRPQEPPLLRRLSCGSPGSSSGTPPRPWLRILRTSGRVAAFRVGGPHAERRCCVGLGVPAPRRP